MKNSISVDSELMKQAMKIGKESDPEILVTLALREFINRRTQKGILELFGKIDWDPSYDYKAGRGRH